MRIRYKDLNVRLKKRDWEMLMERWDLKNAWWDKIQYKLDLPCLCDFYTSCNSCPFGPYEKKKRV